MEDIEYDEIHLRDIQEDVRTCAEVMASFLDDTEFQTNIMVKEVHEKKDILDAHKVDLYDTLQYKTKDEMQTSIERIKKCEYEYNMTMHSIREMNGMIYAFFDTMKKYTNLHHTIVNPLENEGYFLLSHKGERVHAIYAMKEYTSMLQELLDASLDKIKKAKIQYVDSLMTSVNAICEERAPS